MRKRRILSLVTAAALTAAALGGCGSSGNGGSGSGSSDSAGTTAAQTTAAAKEEQKGDTKAPVESEAAAASEYEVTEPVSIEFWYNGSVNEEFYNNLAAEFNASQENITVVPICGGDYSAIKEKMTAAQAAGSGLPGVCLMDVVSLVTYMENGVCEPLDAYCDAYGIDTSDFIDAFMNAGTYDGGTYAFPHGISVATFYYNRDELAKVGLDQFPATWDEFKTWCKDVYEKTGKTAYTCACMQNNILYNFTYNWGADLVKEDGTSGFDNETLKTYIKDIKEMVDAGYIEWSLEGVEAVGNKFLNGDTMAINISCTDYGNYVDNEFEVGLAWNYTAEKGISSVAGSLMFIPSGLDQASKNAAFVFAKYLSDADVNLEWAKFSSYLATHKSTITDEAKMGEIYEALPEMKMVYENYDNYIEKPKTTYFSKAMKPYMEAISQIILEDADFDETWAGMLEEVNYVLAGN